MIPVSVPALIPDPTATPLEPPVLPSMSRPAATYTMNCINPGGVGLEVMINVSDASGGGSLVVSINAVDPVSGNVKLLLASAAISTAVLTRLVIYPTLTASPNLIAQNCVGHDFQIVAVLSTAPLVFSISASTLAG